jgi:predicted nucleotidyltransferase
MVFTKDMKDVIELFEKYKVQYALVGGFAVIYYGYVRTTQDIDFLLFPSEENASRVMKALTEFGFGNAGIPEEYFTKEGTAIHIGVEPNRIDFLTVLKGISNTEIFKHIERVDFEGTKLNLISRSDLLISKKASGRLKDLADAEELENMKKRD